MLAKPESGCRVDGVSPRTSPWEEQEALNIRDRGGPAGVRRTSSAASADSVKEAAASPPEGGLV